MKRACILLALLALSLGSAQAASAQKRAIRWLTSIYSDSKDVALRHPEGVACTGEYLVIGDTGNARLLRYSYEGRILSAEAEYPMPKSYPLRLHVNSRDEIFFLDGVERRIAMVSADGQPQGFLEYTGLPSRGEIVPKSFALDRNDNFYLLDIFSARVLVLDRDGKYLREVPFPEERGFFTDLAVDYQGTLFLLDGVEARVYSATRGAERFTAFTDSLKEYMNFPTSIAVDQEGVLYLIDQYGSGLALVGRDGSFLGRKLTLGWKDSGLYYPSQICVSGADTVFIADRSNNRVQMFSTGASKARTDDSQASEPAE